MKFTPGLFALTLASFISLPAVAALPTGTLTFAQRTGTVAADQAIAVQMILTLDADSAPLTFSSDPLTGFLAEDLPTQGQFWNPDTEQIELRDFASVQGAFLNTWYSCQGDFTNICSAGEYEFQFNVSGTPENPSVNFLESFTLEAGQSYSYTVGFFVPKAGGATPGVYRWNGTAVTLNFRGVDADGNEVGGVPNVLTDAPLGTYLGWNVTAGGARPFHQGQICNYVGGMIPFARTQAERLANGDPRLSLEERYVDVSIRRWEQRTGRSAILAKTGETFAQVSARRLAMDEVKRLPKPLMQLAPPADGGGR